MSLEYLCLTNYTTLYKKFRGSRGYNQQQFCQQRKIPQLYTKREEEQREK